MLTRWSLPEPTPARVIAPEYDKAYRRAMGYDLPARPAHLCILGPDYSCRCKLSKEALEALPDDDPEILAAKEKTLADAKAAREAKAEARRQATRERQAKEKAEREAKARANKKKGYHGKHVKFADIHYQF